MLQMIVFDTSHWNETHVADIINLGLQKTGYEFQQIYIFLFFIKQTAKTLILNVSYIWLKEF